MSRKEHQPTIAQQLFKDKQLINERPEGMSYIAYKMMREHQTKLLKVLLAGDEDKRLIQAMGGYNRYNHHPRTFGPPVKDATVK